MVILTVCPCSVCICVMQRCPLETLVLKTKLLDMGEPIALLSQALSPPDLDNIERTILSLKQVTDRDVTCCSCFFHALNQWV